MQLKSGAVTVEQHVHRLPRARLIHFRRHVTKRHLPAFQRHKLLRLHKDPCFHKTFCQKEHRNGNSRAGKQRFLFRQLLKQRQQECADDQRQRDGGIRDHIFRIRFYRDRAVPQHVDEKGDTHIDGVRRGDNYTCEHTNVKLCKEIVFHDCTSCISCSQNNPGNYD